MSKITINTDSLTPEKADFVTGHCEKAFQRTLDDRSAIQKKGTFVLGILSAIIAFFVNLIVSNLSTWTQGALLFLSVEVGLLVLASIPIIWWYLPSKYAGFGYDPSNIITGEFLDQDLDSMKIGYNHELQDRIDYNRAANGRAANRLKLIASFVFLSPVITFFLVWWVWGCPFVA